MAEVKWNLDPTHSEIGFKVRHMMMTNVSGEIEKFDVSAVTQGEDFSTADISFTADLATITTRNADRDAHLRGADFFDVENHPQLVFKSTKVEKKDDENYEVSGDLTIKGVTKPVTLDVEFGGIGKDPYGNTKAGFTISGKIKRGEFGLNWNTTLETGGVLVSDDVRLAGEIQLVRSA